MGKLDMKLFGSSLFGQAITAAGVGAALLLSVSAGNAQNSGPFAGFDGAWSGTGIVSLADGATERIRCKADYKVNGTGMEGSVNRVAGSRVIEREFEQGRGGQARAGTAEPDACRCKAAKICDRARRRWRFHTITRPVPAPRASGANNSTRSAGRWRPRARTCRSAPYLPLRRDRRARPRHQDFPGSDAAQSQSHDAGLRRIRGARGAQPSRRSLRRGVQAGNRRRIARTDR